MKDFLAAISLLPPELRDALTALPPNDMHRVNEVRFRSGCPAAFCTADGIYYATGSKLSFYCSSDTLRVSDEEMQNLVFSLARRSLHTYQDMIARGYIPLRHGCKAGVAGRAVLRNGRVSSVSSFHSVNIRIAREYRGCSGEVASAVGEDCPSFLLIGRPMSGKTTLLRDLCRRYAGVAAQRPKKIAVIDERDEIASRAFGDGLDLGEHADVLSLYPKRVGMDIALRTLSPDLIMLDEIGADDEVDGLLSCMNSGVGLIATAHGNSLDEVLRRPNIRRVVESGAFRKAVVLDGVTPGHVKEVLCL